MSTEPSHPSPDPTDENIGSNKVNEVTEMDLWDIDFGSDSTPAPPESAPRPHGQLPVQRKSKSKIKTRKPSELKPKAAEAAEPEESDPLIGGLPEKVSDEAGEIAATDGHPESDDDVFADFPELEQSEPSQEWERIENETTGAEVPKPAAVIPAIGSLSKIEKIAISALCAVLALGAILTLIHFSNRVPTRPLIREEVDFPVSGKIVEITGAETYWREPITTGEKAEVVRRGTKLIPVLKLSLSSNSGAIRVFFRNEEGLVVGDGITRTVKGESEVTVAATAGFEDVGMHTAYRTGDGKRWVVQVFEAPDATSPREKFRKVLETEISTQIR
jgi:hypothetical protein